MTSQPSQPTDPKATEASALFLEHCEPHGHAYAKIVGVESSCPHCLAIGLQAERTANAALREVLENLVNIRGGSGPTWDAARAQLAAPRQGRTKAESCLDPTLSHLCSWPTCIMRADGWHSCVSKCPSDHTPAPRQHGDGGAT